MNTQPWMGNATAASLCTRHRMIAVHVQPSFGGYVALRYTPQPAPLCCDCYGLRRENTVDGWNELALACVKAQRKEGE